MIVKQIMGGNRNGGPRPAAVFAHRCTTLVCAVCLLSISGIILSRNLLAQNRAARTLPLTFRLEGGGMTLCPGDFLDLHAEVINVSGESIAIASEFLWSRRFVLGPAEKKAGVIGTGRMLSEVLDPAPWQGNPDYVVLRPGETYKVMRSFHLKEDFFRVPGKYLMQVTYAHFREASVGGVRAFTGSVKSNDVEFEIANCSARREKDKLNQGDDLFPILDAARGSSDARMGYIDRSGRQVIGFRFYSADEFREGLARVVLKMGGKEGYIDTSGRVVIAPRYEQARPFFEGRAAVQLGGKWGYIDREGKLLGAAEYDHATMFSEGLAAVRVEDKWGYVNRSGRLAIPAQFDRANKFSEGLACVVLNGKRGYIDSYGNWVLTPPDGRFASATDALLIPNFSEGLAVFVSNGKYGYMNESGAVVIEPRFQHAGQFSEGFAPVRVGSKFGFIDPRGELVIRPQFDGAFNFSDGLAAVKVGDKWGFVNRDGVIAIRPQFDEFAFFKSGVARITIADSVGYINKAGAFIWRQRTPQPETEVVGAAPRR